jgi:putative nucleotidyltransferase with HDIG domain
MKREPLTGLDTAPELSCRPLKPMFLAFRKLKSDDELRSALSEAGVNLPLAFLEDESNWVSFEVSQRILDALSEAAGVSDFPRRAGHLLATPEVLGFAYSGLKAFGNVKLCFAKVIERSPNFNKVGSFTVKSIAATGVVIEYHSQVREPNRRFCEFRTGQFQSLPTIWGLPLARATEDSCQVLGAPCCTYRFEWQLRPIFRDTVIGTFGGMIAGAAGVFSGLVDASPALAAAASGVLGAILGALLDSQRELRARDSLLELHNRDLDASLTRLGARYEEITVLNRTLEEKVDARTHELSEARDELQAALAKAVALDRAKTRFFTNISHELRTPLTLILAPLETALSDWTDQPASRRDQLQMMHRNGVRLLDNINQLLDLSRLDAGRARLKLEDVDACALLQGLVEASQGLAHQRGIRLTFESAKGLPPVPADRDMLEKIALNLIGNALKFTRPSPSRPAPFVAVRARAEQGRFIFSVEDSGIGIPRDQLAIIFERFSQVSDGDRREYGGSGIGLALARELAEFHMGSIAVVSEPDVGSSFTVSMPLSRAAIPDDRVDRRREQKEVIVDRRGEIPPALPARPARSLLETEPASDRPGAAATQGHGYEHDHGHAHGHGYGHDESPTEPELPAVAPAAGEDRPTLLLVDDNLDMLSFLSQLLTRDYRVLTAGDGEAGLAVARREHPALVVSDVMMPRMDGYALLRELRSQEDTRHIPVVLLTAKSELSQKIYGLEEGADDYLSKPFNFLEFKTRVRSLLRNRELERLLAEKNDYLNKLNFDLVLSKKEVFLQTIEAITFALEAKDTYTHGHSYRVAVLASNLGRELRLSEAEVERVRLAALLHDVGKIGIAESVLRKPGKLTPEEYLEIQRHPTIGAKILERVGELKDVTRCILYHHEAWDGTGYPSKLHAREIPLESRVIAIADTYDAMTSDRAYRRGLGHARAIQELRTYAGRQFDPEMVRVFLRLYEEHAPTFPSFPSMFTGSE